MYEIEGKLLLPPLVRTIHGWAEQGPPPWECGSRRFLNGWLTCSCRVDWDCRTRSSLGTSNPS